MDFLEFRNFVLFKIDDHAVTLGELSFVVLLFFVLRLLMVIIKKAFKRAQKSSKYPLDQGKTYTIQQLLWYLIIVVWFLISLNVVGIDLTALAALGAALLVGIGFGLQNIVNDFVSGFVILFEGNVQVGDIIEVDGLVARVLKINIRTTQVETRDGNLIIMPNSTITGNNMTNWSGENEATRFKVSVGVAYGSETQKVKNILETCARSNKEVLSTRPVVVVFADFADSSLNFDLYFWADKTWGITMIESDLRFAIDKQFREEGIAIPFPQRDLHIISKPD